MAQTVLLLDSIASDKTRRNCQRCYPAAMVAEQLVLAVWQSPLAEWLALTSSVHHCQRPQYVQRNILLLLLKKIGNARLGEGDCHPISPKTPAPHYQPIEEKKRKGK